MCAAAGDGQVKTSKSNNIINWGKIQQLQKSNNLHLAKNDHKRDSSAIKILKTENEKYEPQKPILPSCIDVTVNGQPWKMRGGHKPNTMKGRPFQIWTASLIKGTPQMHIAQLQ